MKNSICVIILFSTLLSINDVFAQKTNTCEVIVWKGRKAHYTAEKIALYTGKDVKNSAVVFYDDYSFKTQVWRKNENGIMALKDTLISDKIYRVTDTTQCRDFRIQYCVSYKNVVVKGKKQTVKGLCETAIVGDFKKKLMGKLIQEGCLTELPDENLQNAHHVLNVAIMTYQEKMGLSVGGLSLETVKLMQLTN